MALKRLPDGRIPVVLSAHAEELVSVDARAIADYLERFPETAVAQVARQLCGTRRVRMHRAVLRAADRLELIDGLGALTAGREHPLVARSALGTARRRAFVFPGQGGHWPGMGVNAYRALPSYRTSIDSCAAAFETAGIASPLRYLTSAGDLQTFSEIEIQGAQFVHAVALAEVWRSCGVLPDLTIGQSLGEIAAAVIAGSIALSDAVAVVAARAGVVDRLSGRYAMAALGIGAPAAEALITATDGWAELSVVYSASTVAISGDRDAVLAIVDKVHSSGQFAREIGAGFPGHTSLLEQFRDELRTQLPASEFAEAPVQFIGGTTGDVVTSATPFGEYWYANLRNTVRLDRAFQAAIRRGAGSFIELSAHPALLLSIDQIFEDDQPEGPEVLVGSARRDEPLADTLSANIVIAAVAEPGYAWGDYLDGATDGDAGLHEFPNAPMRAIPMWAHPEPLPPVAGTTRGPCIAVEHWERTAAPTPVSRSPVHLAVIDLGADGPLTRPLRAAIEAHPAAEHSAPRDAEIVVAIAPTLGCAGAYQAAEALTGLIGAGLLDYANALGPRCQTVCLVTVGAEQVGHQDGLPAAVHAALAAMHRSIGFDYPEQTFTHLDLPSWALTPGTGYAVVDALLTGTGETALRSYAGGYAMFERSFRDAPAASQWSLDSGVLDDVVVTGSAGVIGLHYTRYLAEHGARRIVLLSRRSADPELLKALAAQYGTELVSAPCDITDPAQLSLAAAEYGGAGASLIVHAAGSATFGTLRELSGMTPAAINDTFAAKVSGLAHLAELWPVRSDARMLLCSSVSGMWGGRGHAVYSAANRLLDVMAAELRAGGRHCVAVKWGLWQMPTDGEAGRGIVDAAEMADIERSGLRQMVPREAIDASLQEWHDDPLVFSADQARLRVFLNSRRFEPPGKRYRGAEVATDSPSDTTVSIADAVRSQLRAVLGIGQAGELNLAESLFDLGVDSMLAVDLRKRLKRTTGRTVALATLLGEITGDELVEKLEGADELRQRTESGHFA